MQIPHNSLFKIVDKYWYKKGTNIIHREDGAAIERFNGSKLSYQNGIRHRIDGPAAEYNDGNKYDWYYGKYIEVSTDEEYFRYLKLKAFW